MHYLEDHQKCLDSEVKQYDANNDKFQFLVTSSDYDPTLAAETDIYTEMAKDAQPTRSNKDETEISRLLGTQQKTTQRCLEFNTESVKNNILLVCNLLYLTNTNNRHVDGTFASCLKKYMSVEKTTPAWSFNILRCYYRKPPPSFNLNASNQGQQKSWFPLGFRMTLDKKEKLEIGSLKTDEGSDAHESCKLSEYAVPKIKKYRLSAAVCYINDRTQCNMVALVHVRKS
ncbi:PAN2-PAN3 deadenylation complex catalytic subunit PAN2-like [Topomyia yanbarensis]|uniref:PAN2-PAN3 deadenylation complex catalytic subunit PAN2-like n=1 Tax=Topomyia yanbarensis TaxID=2498891 RepID=UPI00273C7A23|nr:PAN2-PAN3 deadenylation complex catalytic subunit PAN2-like [Topomyia yanbarensis]